MPKLACNVGGHMISKTAISNFDLVYSHQEMLFFLSIHEGWKYPKCNFCIKSTQPYTEKVICKMRPDLHNQTSSPSRSIMSMKYLSRNWKVEVPCGQTYNKHYVTKNYIIGLSLYCGNDRRQMLFSLGATKFSTSLDKIIPLQWCITEIGCILFATYSI